MPKKSTDHLTVPVEFEEAQVLVKILQGTINQLMSSFVNEMDDEDTYMTAHNYGNILDNQSKAFYLKDVRASLRQQILELMGGLDDGV